MSYLLYLLVCWLVMLFCVRQGIELPDESTLLIIAILTAGEVISWRCKK